MARAARLLVAFAAGLAMGCSPDTPAQPTPDAWTPPPDWVAVAANDGSVHLVLPPWLVAFDGSGAIFASEAPPAPGADIPMQLMALPPGADDQPQPGQDLAAWIASRLASEPGQGRPAITQVALPAGPAVRYDRTDRAGAATAWRFIIYAIRTPVGAAFLQFDGPPESWPTRLGDIERVARLAWFR